MLEAHDFDGGEMLARLWLRAGFVAGDEQEGSVHDGGTVQHGRHENVVTWAIHKGHVSRGDDRVSRRR